MSNDLFWFFFNTKIVIYQRNFSDMLCVRHTVTTTTAYTICRNAVCALC